MTLAAHIFGNTFNSLDHLAPLASLLKIPLILTDQEIYAAARKFYPELEIVLHQDYVTLETFLRKNYQGLISCSYQQQQRETILSSLFKQKMLRIWLPHGNSDKSMEENLFSLLKEEKVALIYGNKMLDAFKQHGVLKKIPHQIVIGNFRLHYFQKHRSFYQKKTKQLLPFKNSKKTLFYAPTWGNEKHNLHILKTLRFLIENLSSRFNFIIKPHPFSLDRMDYEFARLKTSPRDSQNNNKYKDVVFIRDFHAIYPLLDQADLYLGDFSSIGYDFLFFNRPLFFLNYGPHKQSKAANKFLLQSGVEIKKEAEIVDKILQGLKNDRFSKKRKEIYNYTFNPLSDLKKIKKDLEKLSLLEQMSKPDFTFQENIFNSIKKINSLQGQSRGKA